MNQPSIFISCGQYTDDEKQLGKSIARMVKAITGLEPFFAEEVQDLNGLDVNILNALRRSVGFITVLHPRGVIKRPDGTDITRASLWIEQEIAIATYIQRIEGRELPIIAFKHSSVGLEGIRSLLSLNPIVFTSEADVLVALSERLQDWRTLAPAGIQLRLASTGQSWEQGHAIRTLELIIVNDTPRPLSTYNLRIEIPRNVLKHWSASYSGEVMSPVQNLLRLEFDQRSYGPIAPRSEKRTLRTNYCMQCAGPDLASGEMVGVTLWVEGQEYRVRRTIKELMA